MPAKAETPSKWVFAKKSVLTVKPRSFHKARRGQSFIAACTWPVKAKNPVEAGFLVKVDADR